MSAAPTPANGWLLWLIGVLALLAAAGLFWWHRRQTDADAASWAAPEPEAPMPVPAAASRPVAPPAVPAVPVEVAPVAAPPKPAGGLITVALRPEISVDLHPVSAGIDSLRATTEFVLMVRNTGRAPAYDVTVEAWMIGAGSDPRGELLPLLSGPPVAPMLPPFTMPASANVEVPGQGMAAREALPTISAGERQLFVPLIGVRARWQDGSGRSGTTLAAFLIGAERAGHARLAPLALDRGARTYRTIAARPYAL